MKDRFPALRLTLLLVAFLVIALTGVTILNAQESVVQVSGTATDPSSAVVPGVTVTATNQETQRVTTPGPALVVSIFSAIFSRVDTKWHSKRKAFPGWNTRMCC